MSKEDLLKVRAEKNKKKPAFIRQDTNKKIRLRNKAKWRKPKGRHSKTRLCKKGHESMPTTGWGSPREVKHLHKSGLKQILVHCLADLEAIDKATEGIIVSRVLGKRKKIDLIKKADEKGIKILNIKDSKGFAEKVMKEKEEKKKQKAEREAKKAKKKTKPKKEEKKEKVETEEEETGEEKKKSEKKEKDKVLTKKT